MYKVLVLISSLFIFANASAALNIECSPELKPYIDNIQKLPEVNEILETIWKEGPIKVMSSRNNHIAQQFGACWDTERRIIFVNADRPKGQVYKSIIFEMHNALVNSKMDDLDRQAISRQIGREDYIRGIEYLEYVNSKNGAKIADLGIAKGLFPSDCRFHTYRDFEEHYRWQVYGGHSDVIGRNYDYLTTP